MTANDTEPTVGMQLVRQLEALGVDTVFGIPGSHNLQIFAGLAESGITLINPRHEQGAGFGADGYARASGRPGVFVTTTGPGILNAATALATSHADSVPVLAISPGARIAHEGHELGWLHESRDQHGSIGGLVQSIRCRNEETVYIAIAKTFARWNVERPRPVHLDIPIDVLEAPARLPLPTTAHVHRPVAAVEAIAQAAEALIGAAAPVIVAGGGAVGARDQVNEVAELLGAPLVTTRAAAGLAAGDEAAATTVLPYAPEAILDADVLLVVGSEMSQRDIPPAVRGRLGRVVRIDIEPSRLAGDRASDVSILGDAAATLGTLVAVLRESGVAPRSDRGAREAAYSAAIADAYPGHLLRFHRALAEILDDDVVITGDSSQVSYLGTGAHYPFRRPRSFLYPDAFAPLGYGLPAAIGAKLSEPERDVVALVGDGAFLFSVQELSTAVEHRVPVLVVIVANGGYLEIEQEMEAAGVPPIGVRFSYPDLAAVAESFGATAAHASGVDDLRQWYDYVRSEECAGPVVVVLPENTL